MCTNNSRTIKRTFVRSCNLSFHLKCSRTRLVTTFVPLFANIGRAQPEEVIQDLDSVSRVATQVQDATVALRHDKATCKKEDYNLQTAS